MFNPDTIIPDSIVAIVILATFFMVYKAVKPFFKKKERFSNSVKSSRTQNDLIGRKQK